MSFKLKTWSQPIEDVNGVWEVNYNGQIRIDSVFEYDFDSFGNQIEKLVSIDTLNLRDLNLKRSIWEFNNHTLKIKREILPGRFYEQQYQFIFLESGLLLTSNNNQLKYYIEQIKNDKLVLINSDKTRIELIKK